MAIVESYNLPVDSMASVVSCGGCYSSTINSVPFRRLCREMALHLLKCDDQLLEETFAEYLQLPVFPVPLEYHATENGGIITETSQSDSDLWKMPKVCTALIGWVELHRLPYFVRSNMYTEYCFCKEILKRRGHVDLHVVTYSQFKCFRCKLVGTIGETHLNLWLSLKRLFPLTYTDRTIANEFNFERLSLIRKQHQLILEQIGLPQFPSYGKHISKIKWTEYVLSELMQRLSDYWWPRVLINRCRGDCVYYESCHVNNSLLTFHERVLLDSYAGRPFLSFLTRYADKETLVHYQFLFDIHQLLQLTSQPELSRAIAKMFFKYGDNDAAKIFGFSTKLLFKSQDNVAIRQSFLTISEKILLSLKQKWSMYMHKDYQSFCSCIPPNLQNALRPTSVLHSTSETPVDNTLTAKSLVAKNRTRTSFCKTPGKLREIIVSMSDLIGSPLEALPTPQSVEDFKKYLAALYSVDSQQYASFDLWMNVLIHFKIPKSKRSRNGKILFRKMLALSSITLIDLPKGITPATVDFSELKAQLLEKFAQDLANFLKILNNGVSPLQHSMQATKADLPLFHTLVTEDELTPRERNQFGASLNQFLEENIIEKSRKMIMFERYLTEIGPTVCPQLYINSLFFWIEVRKFQVIQHESASVHFVAKKVGALVDRYLDTDSPPWIKITLSDVMAQSLTDIASTLATELDNSHVEKAFELLAKCKEAVLSELVNPWIAFNKIYRSVTSSPSLSTIGTTVTSTSLLSKSSIKLLQVPSPTLSGSRRPSLLSYSRQDGLQWLHSPMLSSPLSRGTVVS